MRKFIGFFKRVVPKVALSISDIKAELKSAVVATTGKIVTLANLVDEKYLEEIILVLNEFFTQLKNREFSAKMWKTELKICGDEKSSSRQLNVVYAVYNFIVYMRQELNQDYKFDRNSSYLVATSSTSETDLTFEECVRYYTTCMLNCCMEFFKRGATSRVDRYDLLDIIVGNVDSSQVFAWIIYPLFVHEKFVSDDVLNALIVGILPTINKFSSNREDEKKLLMSIVDTVLSLISSSTWIDDLTLFYLPFPQLGMAGSTGSIDVAVMSKVEYLSILTNFSKYLSH